MVRLMRWGLLIGLFFCGLSFVVGLFVGGVDWGWRLEGHTSEVAFWSMIGGWLSGVATLFAVIVSLWMAYQASQNNVEKILITVEPLRSESVNGTKDYSVIKVKNLKPLDAPLMNIFIQIDSMALTLEHVNLGIQNLPYTLHFQGEEWQFETKIGLSIGWRSIFQLLSYSKQPISFKKGYFIIETAMKQHRVKIPKEILYEIKRNNSLWKEEYDA